MLKGTVGFIGFGRMGGALAKGAVAAGVLKPQQIFVCDAEAAKGRAARAARFHVAASVDQLLREAGLVFLCVKPQQMADVLATLKDARRGLGKKAGAAFVSIAAGVTIARLRDGLGAGAKVARVMPNTPALLKSGMSAVSFGPGLSGLEKKSVLALLASVGEVVQVPESKMDAVTAVSGSGPAYVFALAEAMIVAGQKLGLAPKVARQLVHQTVFGAGVMLRHRPESAADLRVQVTSPGGTTAAALAVLEAKKFKEMVSVALSAAARRSKDLSESVKP